MLDQPGVTVLPPQKAVEIAAAVLHRITGRTSPDILLVASNLWFVRHCDIIASAASAQDQMLVDPSIAALSRPGPPCPLPQ